MRCNRGQANPDRNTTLKLFADSGGYCQRPDCASRLFVDTGTKTVFVAEIAHIIAASPTGPRAGSKITQLDKWSYDNLILLCSNCHTVIDKAPEDYAADLIHAWKQKHADRIRSLFGAVEYGDRRSARMAIEPILTENRALFEQFGPNNYYREDAESELAHVWQRKLKSIIMPNNRKLLAIIDANISLLTELEVENLALFRQHADDLEAKHLGDGGQDVASTFPKGMDNILSESQT